MHPALMRPIYIVLASLSLSWLVSPNSSSAQAIASHQIKGPGAITYVDPNVYAYRADFASRYQMPPEWVSPQLEGADAMALRVTSDYVRCVAGAAQTNCLPATARCEIDLYFDHARHPLPWHPASPEVFSDQYWSSVNFIDAAATEAVIPRAATLPLMARPLALVDPVDGRAAHWRIVDGTPGSEGEGWVLTRYDQQLDRGMAMLTLAGDCHLGEQIILSADRQGSDERPHAVRNITLPIAWKARVAQMLQGRQLPEPAVSSSERQPGMPLDPHVYVYTAQFAQRYGMPLEWVSSELAGVDAVAYRMVPAYVECGWNGDPGTCYRDAMRCEMDMYFDHRHQPLPWDGRRPPSVLGDYAASAHFIGFKDKLWRLLPREGDNVLSRRAPFVDKESGLAMTWRGGYWNSEKNKGGLFMGLAEYDSSALLGLARVTLAGACPEPPDALWLNRTYLDYSQKEQAFKLVVLPASWRDRVMKHTRERQRIRDAFFKREGMKALEKVRGSHLPAGR